MKKRSRKELIPLTGSGAPPGAVRTERGVRFAFFSRKAKQVTLLLYEIDASEPFATFPLTRSGDMRHIEIDGLFPPFEYLYLCETEGGEIRVADPYARRINTREQWGAPPPELRGRMYAEPSFDWQDSCRPLTPWGESIIYEMHVRGFTRDPSSRVRHPGRFTAIIEKIPYLKELGITAVELMPLHEFDETETHGRVGPRGERLHNYWGYGSTHFFAPMKRFGAPEELKTVVRELHKSGIEVIVDVVYNHTSDRFPSGPDGESYHIMHEGHHTNYSGCGNTLRCQHPVVRDLILSSLRYYMTEFQVDGFRFDLASVLTRNETGSPMDAPPLIAEITKDPVLAPAKLIAEAWDPGGLYQVATFPSWRFATWNDRFRDDVRAFIRGDEGEEIRENMKSRLLGSPDLYGEKGSPLFGINFITAHDGFTLCDLVSYESKRNMANGEDNRDGSDHNTSCNYGTEGETDDPEIGKLRHRQMRNFLLALFVSQGVPMLLMGDEYGHTRFGNNNAYCHDNALNRFLWDRPPFLSDFIKRLIRIRKARPELRQERFVDKVTWEGEGYLGMNLEGRLFILFNPTKNVVSLPDKQEREGWQLLISTADEPVTNRFGPYTSAVFLAPSLCTRS